MSDEARRTNVLLEDLRSQFRTFGEGLQLLNDKVDRLEEKLDTHTEENRKEFMKVQSSLDQNHQEHQLFKQMVEDLSGDVKRLDTEVVQIKRVK